jgi:hypothetical protein
MGMSGMACLRMKDDDLRDGSWMRCQGQRGGPIILHYFGRDG